MCSLVKCTMPCPLKAVSILPDENSHHDTTRGLPSFFESDSTRKIVKLPDYQPRKNNLFSVT